MLERSGLIYVLIDPRDNLIKYIGQTRNDIKERLRAHLYNAHYYKKNNKKDNWLKLLFKNNLVPIIEVLEYNKNISDEELDFLESYYINLFLSWGFDLKNGTLGGKSGRCISKRKRTVEEIEKQRLSLINSYKTKKIVNANKGKKMSEEQKKKLSENTNFKSLSKESIIKRSISNTGKKRDELQKENISKGIKESILKSSDYRIIKCYDKDGTFIGIFETPRDVAKFIGTNNIPNITACLKGRIKSTKGYLLSYGDKDETEKYLKRNKIIFQSFNDIIYTKKELLKMTISERENLVEEIYNSINSFVFPNEILLSDNEINKIIKGASNLFDADHKMFSNHFSYSWGVTFLKSYFKSFYKASNKGSLSVYEKINKKINLREVIRYRIGLNNTGEIWDLSFKTIIRGYSAIRGLVSFFKPSVAYSIYKELGKNPNVVLDPCCGFGGRMLGYFLLNPKGCYIGCEPNPETYNELLNLKNEISRKFGFGINCILYNTTIEDFVELYYSNYKEIIEFAFTSIPYYDLETYSIDIVTSNYTDFNDWNKKFIGSLKQIKNLWLNMTVELKEKLDLNGEEYYLVNNVSSHLDKSKKEKKEVIIKIN